MITCTHTPNLQHNAQISQAAPCRLLARRLPTPPDTCQLLSCHCIRGDSPCPAGAYLSSGPRAGRAMGLARQGRRSVWHQLSAHRLVVTPVGGAAAGGLRSELQQPRLQRVCPQWARSPFHDGFHRTQDVPGAALGGGRSSHGPSATTG